MLASKKKEQCQLKKIFFKMDLLRKSLNKDVFLGLEYFQQWKTPACVNESIHIFFLKSLLKKNQKWPASIDREDPRFIFCHFKNHGTEAKTHAEKNNNFIDDVKWLQSAIKSKKFFSATAYLVHVGLQYWNNNQVSSLLSLLESISLPDHNFTFTTTRNCFSQSTLYIFYFFTHYLLILFRYGLETPATMQLSIGLREKVRFIFEKLWLVWGMVLVFPHENLEVCLELCWVAQLGNERKIPLPGNFMEYVEKTHELLRNVYSSTKRKKMPTFNKLKSFAFYHRLYHQAILGLFVLQHQKKKRKKKMKKSTMSKKNLTP